MQLTDNKMLCKTWGKEHNLKASTSQSVREFICLNIKQTGAQYGYILPTTPTQPAALSLVDLLYILIQECAMKER